METAKLSIIIPVFNSDKYLCECIESVLSQSITEIELLLVDDGSTDESGVICDRYAVLDNRVFVYHKKNEGATTARKYGVERAHGEWIAFVDSDDRVSPDYYERLLSEKDDNSLLVCAHVKTNTILRRDFIRGLLLNRIHWGMPLKLYHRSLFENNIFSIPSTIRYGEDLIINLYIARYIDGCSLVETDGYFYRSNPESLTHQREWSMEYEKNFIKEVKSALGKDTDKFMNELLDLQLNAWKNLVLNGVEVNPTSEWVVEIKSQMREKKTTMSNMILLYSPSGRIASNLLKMLSWLRLRVGLGK